MKLSNSVKKKKKCSSEKLRQLSQGLQFITVLAWMAPMSGVL